ncbi:response regulator [Parapedobacter lycopersici]|uniref:response regulator n=1 Tax=Parapedobacter lycopersici TaxID=1864939 RepID=UPI00214D25E0
MKKIIHFIEDDKAIAELIAFLLKEEEYNVSIYTNTKVYKEQLFSALPHLLIVDVKLSCDDSLEMCRTWKLDEVTRDIPLLVTSAYEGNRTDERIVSADYFMGKPFSITEFLNRVALLLS